MEPDTFSGNQKALLVNVDTHTHTHTNTHIHRDMFSSICHYQPFSSSGTGKVAISIRSAQISQTHSNSAQGVDCAHFCGYLCEHVTFSQSAGFHLPESIIVHPLMRVKEQTH